jgi:uncharacterized protein
MSGASAQPAQSVRRLTCARCGAVFDCGTAGKNGGCWCMDEQVRLPMPEAGGGDCLCPACLREAIAKQGKNP